LIEKYVGDIFSSRVGSTEAADEKKGNKSENERLIHIRLSEALGKKN
jgi:hypothetical protein